MDQSDNSQSPEVAELERQLASLGLFIAVEKREDTLFLSGEVDSEDDKQAVLDLASDFARRNQLTIDDSIDVLEEIPESALTYFAESDSIDDEDAIAAVNREGIDPIDVQRSIGTSDAEFAAEEGIPYYPPTDPVIEPFEGEEELEIIGGFAPGSYDRSEDLRPGQNFGDERITELVRRELREDATTTDFDIEVETRAGVVFLRGTVETLDDAENVEAVAARVPGVVDVHEELEVVSLMNPPLD
jgi:BON domain